MAQSIMVYWRNTQTGATGSFQGTDTNMGSYRSQLAASGRVVTNVTTIGGGRQVTRPSGVTTTEDIPRPELLEQPPEPTPTPIPEPKEKLPSDPIIGIGSIFESEAFKEHEARKKAEFVPGVPSITPPVSEPSVYERPGITAPTEVAAELPLRPRVDRVKTEREIQEEQEHGIARAEREAGMRIEEERIGFERKEQPEAQDVTQQKYNELIAKKATSLGMRYDVGLGVWVGTTSQTERFHEYEPEARVQAMAFGTDYYQTQWEQFGIGERAEDITREEFGEEGFKLIEKDDGTFTVLTEAEFKRQQRVSSEKERIRARITGTPEERVAQLAMFVSSAFIKPFSETGLLGVIGEAVLGGEDKGEVILGKLAREAEEFRGLAPQELFAKSFIDPEGLGFTVALAAVTTGVGGLLAKVGGPGGRILQKGIPVVVRGALVTTIGAELGITAAMEGKAEAGKLAFRRFGQIAAFETFAALATGRPILPKVQREIVFEAKTGVLTEQRYFDVFGKQLKIPGIRQAQILRPTTPDSFRVLGIPGAKPFGTGPSFKTIVPTAPVKEPFVGGLPAKPSAATFVISKFGDVTFVDTGITKPIVTGIPMPGVYTGRQPVLRGIRSLVEPSKPGKLIVAEPELKFAAITEGMEKNLKFIAKGKEWQPLTGIKEPTIRDITGRVKPYTIPDEKELLGRKPFRVKPKPDVVTRIDVTPDKIEKVTLKEYYRWLKEKKVLKIVPRDIEDFGELKHLPGRKFEIGIRKDLYKQLFPKESAEIKLFESSLSISDIPEKKLLHLTATDVLRHELIHLQQLPKLKVETGVEAKPTKFESDPSFLFKKIAIWDPARALFTKLERGLKEKIDYKHPELNVIKDTDISTTHVVSIEKYGRKLIDVGKVKGVVGEPMPGVFTGRQPVLRGPRPLVEVKRKPGILIKIEETFPLVKRLESGLAPEFEGLIKVKPIVVTKGKQFRLKDIVKPEDDIISKTISGARQKTIQILKEPITKQELKLESLTKTKMKDVVVSKFKAKSIMVTEKQYLESMTQMKQPIVLQAKKLSVGLLLAQDLRSKQLKKSETGIMLDMKMTGDTIQRKVLRFGLLPIQTTAQIKDTSFKFRTILATAFVTPKYEPPITIPPIVKPTVKPFEEEIIKPPTKISTLGLEQDLMKGVSLQPQAYDVYTYKTQFKNGRRIRGKELMKINKKPLRRLDALALGSNRVDNNAKRTIILKPAEGKPTKLRKKVPGWSSQMFEYNDKGNNKFVEKNAHAIDSPGELREITMKGLAARRRGGKRSKGGLPSGISSLEGRLSRRMII